jgi:assimilatory nitrate reductase catalytic subunit
MNSVVSKQIAVHQALDTINPTTHTTCPYCGVGCGVNVSKSKNPHQHKPNIAGIADHPANHGRLCVKGSSLAETIGLQTRLLFPQAQINGKQEQLLWSQALDKIASTFQDTIAEHGADSVAFYVSGQLLTEDYYVANKFVKGFIGTANIDTNSRLCMSSAVAGHKRAFGEDIVPGCYEDFEQADLVVLVGSNTAWCHPVLFQRLAAAKEKRPDMCVVVIDPRHTATCDIADIHLPIVGGSDVALFNGLLHWLHSNNAQDSQFVNAHTQGLSEALETAGKHHDTLALAKLCGVQLQSLEAFFDKFTKTEKVVTLFSMGVNQSSQGTDKVNSIINCHLLTGRIGKAGMGPFSMTGQPNAMGGREVGGLSNMLAAHMDIQNPVQRERVQRFWQSPYIADQVGLKAVDLFEAVEAGKIKALWIMATNPVVSLPNADQVKRALEKCDFVVVSDLTAQTDTCAYADILLPALGWGEKDGTVTNSERCISRQRAFLNAPGDAMPDWWAISQVAKRMGFGDQFDYHHPHDIFEEHAQLSAFENITTPHETQVDSADFRYFNLKGLTELDKSAYDALLPIQWPVLKPYQGTPRLLTDHRFSHPDGKARFIAVQHHAPKHAVSSEFPLILNSGRIRDQWHTMTRTGLAPTLGAHIPEPFIDMHPYDALLSGIKENELARVRSAWGSLVARVQCSGKMRRGQIFVPIHWTAQTASDARVGALVNPVVDPISGEPEFKHTPVRIEPFHVYWHGVAYSRHKLDLDQVSWWTHVQTQSAARYELAGRQRHQDISKYAKNVLLDNDHIKIMMDDDSADYLEYLDESAGIYHAAVIFNNQIQACIYIAPRELLPDREWLANLFTKSKLSARDRMALLAGSALGSGNDAGPLVCSCFKVGKNTIVNAIKEKGLKTPKEVTACVKAGGNCGSCVPEIRGLIATCQVE